MHSAAEVLKKDEIVVVICSFIKKKSSESGLENLAYLMDTNRTGLPKLFFNHGKYNPVVSYIDTIPYDKLDYSIELLVNWARQVMLELEIDGS